MGHEFVYTVNEFGVERKYDHMVFFENNNTYAIICSALTSDFDRLQNTFDFCIETFAMLPYSTPAPILNTLTTEIIYAVTAVIIKPIITITIIIIKKKSK